MDLQGGKWLKYRSDGNKHSKFNIFFLFLLFVHCFGVTYRLETIYWLNPEQIGAKEVQKMKKKKINE